MKRTWGFLIAASLAACESAPPEHLRLDPNDLRDNPIGANASEPPWHDLIRHTTLHPPARAWHPAASRDGRVFVHATNEFGPRLQIALRPTEGAAPTQVTNHASDNLFPSLSPDGKLLAYAGNRDGSWDIFVTRVDAPAAVSQLTFEPQDDIAPAWSPDGRKIVYCTLNDNGVWQLVIVDAASRIKTFLGPGLYPHWSPSADDPWICFQSQPRVPSGRSGVWVIRPDGTGLREVVSDKQRSWSAINPHFSPDGRWIAYATVRKSSESHAFGLVDEADDIWVIRPDGTFDTRLTDDLAAESWPAWGGDRVFFVSKRDGAQNIYSVRPGPLGEDP
jgi:TolB protein